MKTTKFKVYHIGAVTVIAKSKKKAIKKIAKKIMVEHIAIFDWIV